MCIRDSPSIVIIDFVETFASVIAVSLLVEFPEIVILPSKCTFCVLISVPKIKSPSRENTSIP